MASIRKTDAGTWAVRWRDDSGRQPKRTFKTRGEAQDWKTKVESELRSGEYVNPHLGRVRLTDWIQQWLAERQVRPSTAARDETYFDSLILPYFGDKTLAEIHPSQVRRWVAHLSDTKSPATVVKAHQLLAAALDQAVEDRYLARNPAANTPNLPTIERPLHRYLNVSEIDSLAQSIEPRYAALVYMGAMTGLRPGELAAIRISDVDFLRKKIAISRTCLELSGRLTYGPPKTGASRRTISVGEELITILARHVERYLSDDLLFTTARDSPMRLTNFRRRQWKGAVGDSIGEPMRIHDLRHTHAALAIAANVNPKVLQARLGHATIGVTLDTYGGLFSAYDEGLAAAIDDAFTQLPPRHKAQS